MHTMRYIINVASWNKQERRTTRWTWMRY